MTNVPTWSPDATAQTHAITLTAAASAHLKKQLTKRGSGIGMRFGVKKSGCSGYAYTVDLIDEITSNDRVFAFEELVVAVDVKSYPFLRGTEIDYVKEGINAHFKFNNPNEKASCGCGESFTIEDPN